LAVRFFAPLGEGVNEENQWVYVSYLGTYNKL
jgi:hypothetical protein